MLSKKKKKKSYMKQIHKTVPHKTKQHNMKQSKSNSRSLTSPSPDFSIFLNCLNRPIKKLHRKLSRNHQFKEHDIRMDRSIIHSQQVFPSVSIIRVATVPRAQTARPSLQRNERALVYFFVCAIRAGDQGVLTYQAVYK